MNKGTIKIECFEVEQPIGKFYVGKISWQDLLSISYSDKRKIINEGNNSATYLGIQRSLSNARLNEISKYVSFTDATFPSSVVLSVKAYDERDEESNIISYADGILTLKNKDNIAQIIDGQHRVFGLERFIEQAPLFKDDFVFDFIITIFLDIDPEKESMIFSTINKAQTKVNKSLVYDLYGLSKSRSPQRTAHNIVKLLDETENSPFYKRINRLGTAEDKLRETITQATFVERILDFISSPSKVMLDRDLLIRGQKLPYPTKAECQRRIFRIWFIEEKDSLIAKVIWNYFTAVQNKWSDAWSADNQKSILVKSTGLVAFMRFLQPLINELGLETMPTIDNFTRILDKVDIQSDDFVKEKYLPGGIGQNALLNDLKEQTKIGLE